MSDPSPAAPAFHAIFARWAAMREFSGFDVDEFPSPGACARAEARFARNLEAYEKALLDHAPAGFGQMACQIEVIAADEDVGPAGRKALSGIQAALIEAAAREDADQVELALLRGLRARRDDALAPGTDGVPRPVAMTLSAKGRRPAAERE